MKLSILCGFLMIAVLLTACGGGGEHIQVTPTPTPTVALGLLPSSSCGDDVCTIPEPTSDCSSSPVCVLPTATP